MLYSFVWWDSHFWGKRALGLLFFKILVRALRPVWLFLRHPVYMGHSGRFKIDNFFLISNCCHSIQLIQIPGLRVRIQRGDKGSRPGHPLEKHKLYGFLYVISNWTSPPWKKVGHPTPWKKCWTPLWNLGKLLIFLEINHWTSVK